MRSGDGLSGGEHGTTASLQLVEAAADSLQTTESLPAGFIQAGRFALFNGMSWQIMLGAPTILYAKTLGASQWVLGLVASLMPLLVIFQIPAAYHIPRYGYKRFILAGWTSRSLFIFAVAVVPLLPLSATVRLWLIIACLFGFNLLRGITAGAWMPWIAAWIPDSLRGWFLSRDAAFTQLGGLVALLASAALLAGEEPRPIQFTLVFLLSATAATISLLYLRQIPDVTAPEKVGSSGVRVPWLHMLFYGPFLRVLLLSAGWAVAIGALPVFTVAFLKESGYPESRILLLTTLSFVGALLSVPLLGRRADRIGSKPIVMLCLILVIGIALGWWSLASGLVGRPLALVALLYFVLGVAQWNFSIANQRLAMCIIPLMGRNHFCALFTVVGSLATGITPIAWGIVLDLIGQRQWSIASLMWDRYTIFFAVVLLITATVAAYSILLREPPIKPARKRVP